MSEDSGPLLSTDAFILILSNVQISDLFRWRKVSKDFKRIIDYVLRQKNRLSVGKTSGFAKLAVNRLGDTGHPRLAHNTNIADLLKVRKYDYISTLETVLKKCGRVHCLHLRECKIDAKFIKTVTQCLPHLSCLHLNRCDFRPRSNWNIYFQQLECLFINRQVIDESQMTDDERADSAEELGFYYGFLEKLKSITKMALISEGMLEMDAEDEAIISNLPSSLQSVALFKNKTEHNLYLEDVFDIDRFTCLRSIDMRQYQISEEFLLRLNDKLHLISLKFSSSPLDFAILSQIAKKQRNLKTLGMCSMYVQNIEVADKLRPFIKVEKLVLTVFYVRANYQEYGQFFRLFPNLRTLIQFPSGIICSHVDVAVAHIGESVGCKTCYGLTFRSIISEMRSLRSLCICEDAIEPYMEYIFSSDNLLTELSVGESNQFKTEDMLEAIDSQIDQIISAFAQKSMKSPKQVFEIEFDRNYPSLENRDLMPRNLILKVPRNGAGPDESYLTQYSIEWII